MPARALLAVALVCLAGWLVAGCGKQSAQTPVTPPPVPAPEPPPAQSAAEPTPAAPASSQTTVKIATDKGDIICRLFDEQAPITAGNFLLLVDEGFYDGLTFHRREEGFVIQGGDPEGNGTGGPGYSIPLEVSEKLKHGRGVLSMARAQDPDSAGSQFFICLSDDPPVRNLDMGYAVFGEVIEGMDVVDRIAVGDKMVKLTVQSQSPYANAARKKAKAARIR